MLTSGRKHHLHVISGYACIKKYINFKSMQNFSWSESNEGKYPILHTVTSFLCSLPQKHSHHFMVNGLWAYGYDADRPCNLISISPGSDDGQELAQQVEASLPQHSYTSVFTAESHEQPKKQAVPLQRVWTNEEDMFTCFFYNTVNHLQLIYSGKWMLYISVDFKSPTTADSDRSQVKSLSFTRPSRF